MITKWIVAGEQKISNIQDNDQVAGTHMILRCNKVIPSVNPEDWSISYQPYWWSIIRDIKYANNKWVAVGRGSRSQNDTMMHYPILFSENGIDWNLANVSYNYRTIGSEGEILEGYSVDYNGTCWLMTGRLTAYSIWPDDRGIILRSYDGINWDPVFRVNEGGMEHTLYSIKWIYDRWIAVGRIKYNNEYVHVMKSDDASGTNWTILPWLDMSNSNYTVPHRLTGDLNNIFVMSFDKAGEIYTTENNGENGWEIYNTCSMNKKIRDLKCIDEKYYVIGESYTNKCASIAYSKDITYNWTLNICESIGGVCNVINGDENVLLLGGDTGKLAYSTNGGNTWINISLPSEKQLKRVYAICYKKM